MLSMVALALAAASAASASPLTQASPWWEKITVTMSGDGSTENCRYETSTAGAGAEACKVEDIGPLREMAGGESGTYTTITFERRFNPGEQPDIGSLAAGDSLLGAQVMAVAINGEGAVSGCRVIAASGGLLPDYSCDDARAERFQASTGGQAPDATQGFVTVLVYGHQGQLT
ncbi:MAG: hypothetical protein M3Q52_07265 [Pseudomonadota bacterium]|nr:hypothetical protein [Pseudomonadota bacterium]